MFFLNFFADAAERTVMGLVRSIVFEIDKFVYQMIKFTYDIFEMLCRGKLMGNKQINDLFYRIALILGLIMTVSVAFSFIKLLIDPDSIVDSKKGMPSIIKKMIIVIVLLGTSNYIFTLLSNVQTAILNNNMIPNLLLPQRVDTESFGARFSGELFLAFWNQRELKTERSHLFGNSKLCNTDYLDNARAAILAEANYDLAEMCLNAWDSVKIEDITSGEADYDNAFVIDFNWFMSLIVGLVALWLLLSYCLSAAIRVIQLTILQVISPAAIIGYLSPKEDNTFTKWLQVYFSTYIDVFIRLVVLNFMVYLMALLFEDNGVFWKSIGSPTGTRAVAFIKVIMCLALLSFAKTFPELLKKIFPTGASGLNLGLAKKEDFAPALTAGSVLAGGAIGGILGGASGALTSVMAQKELNANAKGKDKLLAGIGGLASGFKNGTLGAGKKGNVFKNIGSAMSNQNSRNNAYRDLVAAGGSRSGQAKAKLQDIFGSSRGTIDTTRVENAKKVEEGLAGMFKLAENSTGYKGIQDRIERAKKNGQWDVAKDLQKRADAYKDEFVRQSLTGEIQNGDSLKYVYTDSSGMTHIEEEFVTGGDKVKGNSISSNYESIRAEVNQITPDIVDENGNVTGHFSLNDTSIFETDEHAIDNLNATIKQAQRTQANVTRQPGYRAGQANKPSTDNKK